MRLRIFATLIGVAAFASASVGAERFPWPSEVFNPPKRANIPGVFDYYLLVLSWSPTHCLEASPGQDEMQCGRRDGRRFGFVLHGLWPQYERGYPERCRTLWRPYVPEPVIAEMRDVMPGRGLVIHEYRAHGTCSGLQPAPYFALARQFFGRIQIPKRYQNPFEMQFVAPAEVMRDFVAANPRLKPDMIAVDCDAPGGRLREIRLCLSKDGFPRACSPSAYPHAACRASKMLLPPVRSTWRPGRGYSRDESVREQPLPKPRVIESPGAF
jgi:ribonuclease T2